jgi:hypothetical protein
MEQSKQQKSLAVKLTIAFAGVIVTAVLSVLIQQLLFGKAIVAVTSAVISIFVFMIWWLLWKSTEVE